MTMALLGHVLHLVVVLLAGFGWAKVYRLQGRARKQRRDLEDRLVAAERLRNSFSCELFAIYRTVYEELYGPQDWGMRRQETCRVALVKQAFRLVRKGEGYAGPTSGYN